MSDVPWSVRTSSRIPTRRMTWKSALATLFAEMLCNSTASGYLVAQSFATRTNQYHWALRWKGLMRSIPIWSKGTSVSGNTAVTLKA